MTTAIICRLTSIRKHPNADKLNLATVLGNQVVIGLEHVDGELGMFVPTDMQLSHIYCLENNLYTLSAQAKLGLPAGAAGYLSEKRRVRSQRFRGEKSDGIFMPLSSLFWVGEATFKEGDAITEVNGNLICEKYYTPATLRAMKVGTAKTRKENLCFPKHKETAQFRFHAESIPEDAVLYITEKLHGTSGRLGHVLNELPFPKWKQFLNTNIFHRGFFKPKSTYTYLNGSKNVILGKSSDTNGGYYGTNDFREEVVQGITLHKGELIFFEIVGYVHDNVPIMPLHDVTKTGLKDIQKAFGNSIHYTYGQPEGTRKIYVYKIATVNEDGQMMELSWPAMVGRCNELGLPHVPLLFGPTTLPHLAHIYSTDGRSALRTVVEQLSAGTQGSTLNQAQIREGVVVRVESKDGVSQLKSKSFEFGVLEGYLSEDDSFVDPEVVS